MTLELDANKILHTVVVTALLAAATTIYSLDREVMLLNYKMDQVNSILQMLSEEKK